MWGPERPAIGKLSADLRRTGTAAEAAIVDSAALCCLGLLGRLNYVIPVLFEQRQELRLFLQPDRMILECFPSHLKAGFPFGFSNLQSGM
jgi:hypothetical protein